MGFSSLIAAVTTRPASVQHYSKAPAAASQTSAHAAITLGAGGTTTAGITHPDVARVPSITGVGAGATGNVVIIGKRKGATVTQTIVLSGASTVNGTKAIDKMTSIQYPADSGATGEQVKVGYSKLIGLEHKVACPVLIASRFNNATDSGSLTNDASALEGNFYTPAGSPDGSKTLDIWYLAG